MSIIGNDNVSYKLVLKGKIFWLKCTQKMLKLRFSAPGVVLIPLF